MTPEPTYKASMLLVKDIAPRENNRNITEQSVSELAASILQDGLQTPITVRPRNAGNKNWEIVAGERRWRAHKHLERETIPAFIKELTDEEAAEYALIENLQRENLHPLEEAQQYEIMLRHPEYTLARLSARVCKELPYLRKRLELLKLIAPARKLLLEERIGIEQAKQLCRIPAASQKAYLTWVGPLDDGRGLPSATKIEEWIEHNVMLDLGKAPFDTTAVKLVPKAGACTDCPKRTGFDKALFDDVKQGDFCLDAPCFNGKVDRLIQITLKTDPEIIQVATNFGPEMPKGVLSPHDYTLLKTDDECKTPSRAISVAGFDRGHRLTICRDNSCKEHAGRHRAEPTSGETPKERETRLKAARAEKAKKETRRTVLKAISEKVEELKHPDLQVLAIAMFYRLWHQLQQKTLRLLEWNRDLKKGESTEDIFAENVEKLKGPALNRVLVILALATHMDGPAYGDKNDALLESATRYKINVDKIKEQVAEKYKKK